jgi:hypothetical protein
VKPQGVRIVRGDGTEILCELVHLGPNGDGVDEWEIANATFRPGLDHIHVAVMPARTALTFSTGSDG